MGLSPFFVGVIVVAVVGNAAEHWVALYFAARDKMDLDGQHRDRIERTDRALRGSRCSCCCRSTFGPHPMALVFNGLRSAELVLAVGIANQVTQEGESTWFEGVQLLGVYVVLAAVFFYVG